ncbi:MAG: hypothetical protein A3J97_00300 [Spirochaetes bacterium RIFOXYC1_FULL_54_7]|nr:MAG: hypothetical protein A3J97_00300 [Spirochaetes bacterium RIFOXYC1_FULL_54_7]
MIFIEQFPQSDSHEPEPQLGTQSGYTTTLTKTNTDLLRVIVVLLPAHPFQYVMHQSVQALLQPEIINKMKEMHGITDLVFIVNKNLHKDYGPLLEALPCQAIYEYPSYPLVSKALASMDTAKTRVLSWYDFIRAGMACAGKTVVEFPVSVTCMGSPGGGRRKPPERRLFKGPISVETIVQVFGLQKDESVFSDHPYAGKSIDPGFRFTEMQATEVLIFPKNTRRSTPLTHRIFDRILPDRFRFSGSYDTTGLKSVKPCHKCLQCVTICPVALHPFILSAITGKGSLKDAAEFDAADCIECGLCNYVCPADLPLMQNIAHLKKEIEA